MIVELVDCRRPLRVIFSWWTAPSGGPTNYSMMNVTLDCPWAFKVTSTISGSFATELLAFIQAIARRDGDWHDAHSIQTPDGDLVISCFECVRQHIAVEVSLDSSWDDPEWTVQLRLDVASDNWRHFANQFEAFVVESRAEGPGSAI